MIDHVAARRLAATAIDLPLEAGDATELDGHLAACPACRNVSAALARDATALRHLDFGPVPVAVRADVAIAAERGRPSPFGRWVGLVVVGALLVVALGSGILGGVGAGRSPIRAPPMIRPYRHRTHRLADRCRSTFAPPTCGSRSAAAAWRRFGSPRSRPDGDANTRTFEATWAPPIGCRHRPAFRRLHRRPMARSKVARSMSRASGDQWLDAQGPFIGSRSASGTRPSPMSTSTSSASRADRSPGRRRASCPRPRADSWGSCRSRRTSRCRSSRARHRRSRPPRSPAPIPTTPIPPEDSPTP